MLLLTLGVNGINVPPLTKSKMGKYLTPVAVEVMQNLS